MACADVNLGAQLPVRFIRERPRDRTESRMRPTCSADDGLEMVFGWTAPEDGTYVIDTAETPLFDTVLYVREGACDGAPLACRDDGISYGRASKLEVSLRGGQTIAIVVDGAQDHLWAEFVHLNISRKVEQEAVCNDGADEDGDGRVDCADPDCSGKAMCHYESCVTSAFPDTVPSTVLARGFDLNRFVGTCTDEIAPDTGFRFTAPATAEYIFMARSEDDHIGPPALFVLDGCRGRELTCSPHWFRSTARVRLQAGETVILVVDSYAWYSVQVDFWRPVETDCTDGNDNDGDGWIDQGDTDCPPL